MYVRCKIIKLVRGYPQISYNYETIVINKYVNKNLANRKNSIVVISCTSPHVWTSNADPLQVLGTET